MKPRTRRLAAWSALLAFAVILAVLVMLRVGRPIWYGDDASATHALALRNSSMLVWSEPEVAFEMPSDVRGRLAYLPDGRILYARKTGTPVGAETELVIWDPERPQLEPELASVLDGPGHDLAPCFAPDGRLYFASDRNEGAGGFDLWSARWTGRGFTDLRRLPDGINSELDESDPAPHPDGTTIAFMRRDPAIASGRHGVLFSAPLSQLEPEASVLFDDPGNEGPSPRFLDRDCRFDAEGGSLWFVRRYEDGRRRLLRTWRHPASSGKDGFVEPLPVPGIDELRSLRGPHLAPGGRELRLIDGARGLGYRSIASEVRPWWFGQRDLEILLLSLAVFFALLFLMLWLGGRWTALDIVTQCLLLSMLIHILLLLWLMRVQIVRTFLPPVPTVGESVEVRLLSDAEMDGGRAPDAAPTQQNFDVSQQQQFEGFKRSMEAQSPESRVAAREQAAVAAPAGQRSEFAEADARSASEAVREELTAIQLRQGTDARSEPGAAETRATKQDAVAEALPQREAVQAEIRSPASAAAATLPRVGQARARPQEQRSLAQQQATLAAEPVRDPKLDATVPVSSPARKSGEDVRAAQPRAASTKAVATSSVPSAARNASPLTRNVARRDGFAQPRTGLPRPLDSRTGSVATERVVDARDAGELSAQLDKLRDPVRAPERRQQRSDGGAATAKLSVARSEIAPDTSALPRPSARTRTEQNTPLRPGELARPSTTLARRTARRRPEASRSAPESVARTERRFDGLVAEAKVEPATPMPKKAAAKAGTDRSSMQQPTRRSVTTERAETVAVAGPSRSVSRPRASVGSRVAPPKFSLRRSRRGAARARASERVARRSARRDLVAAGPALRDASAKKSKAPPERPRRGTSSGTSLQPVETTVRANRADDFARATKKPRFDRQRSGSLEIPGTRIARAPRRVIEAVRVSKPRDKPKAFYANRFGEKKVEALERFGGTKETERAVQNGLRYLAKIQRDDGGWGKRGDWDSKYGEVRVGKSALCLLAFLGAGNLPPVVGGPGEPDRLGKGEYATNVVRAIDFLLASQDENTGHFGVSSAYSHGITTYALAECYAMTKMEKLRAPLEAAIDWILENQNERGPRHSLGGWGYYSPRLRPEDRYARASVSSWQIMALESARRSGLDVPDRALALAKRFLLQMFDDRYGYFLYTKAPSRLRMSWRTLPASTPASVFSLLLLGHDAEDERIAVGLDYTTARRIRRYRRASDDDFVLRGEGNPYFWYYGTLACFFRGGEAWKRWNETLRVQLPRGQSPDGSFAPVGAYASYAKDTRRDRAFTTAMCVLSLEVYYRYFTPLLEKRRSKIR